MEGVMKERSVVGSEEGIEGAMKKKNKGSKKW